MLSPGNDSWVDKTNAELCELGWKYLPKHPQEVKIFEMQDRRRSVINPFLLGRWLSFHQISTICSILKYEGVD